jgi:hypothetical protein
LRVAPKQESAKMLRSRFTRRKTVALALLGAATLSLPAAAQEQ